MSLWFEKKKFIKNSASVISNAQPNLLKNNESKANAVEMQQIDFCDTPTEHAPFVRIKLSKPNHLLKKKILTYTSGLTFFFLEVDGPGEFVAGGWMTICPVIDDKELLV